jgi:polyhydroxybutyrate depolymerase
MRFRPKPVPHRPARLCVRVVASLVALGVVASACSQSSPAALSKTSESKTTGDSGRSTGAATVATVAPRPSPGCASAPQAELTLAKRTLTVDRKARWYLISTPPSSSRVRPLPLVLDIHGLDEGAQIEALTTQLGPLGQRVGFISVFPEGTGSPLQWDTDATGPNYDLDYVQALLDQVEADQCVDETRVYATGLSDGAFMTSLLACDMSNRIAAFAPVSGVQLPSPCHATRRVPILAFHGTADPILLFNGGIGLGVLKHALGQTKGPAPSTKVPPANLNGPGYPATVASWAKRDGCAANPVDTKLAPQVIRRVYRCPAGVAVEFYIIIGGGHAWPGSKFSEEIAAITGPTTFEINASTTIWAFFKRFQL